jgi:hypothetical protein
LEKSHINIDKQYKNGAMRRLNFMIAFEEISAFCAGLKSEGF